jgi:hypothetical protein
MHARITEREHPDWGGHVGLNGVGIRLSPRTLAE